jgi:Bifunctional DNA primase/polymerase, N-terminal
LNVDTPRDGRSTANNRILTAALDYASRGWAVFPVPPGTKRSYKRGEFSNGRRWGATRDPDEIRKDWERWPNANIGLPTGADNGFFVVETDTPQGHAVDGAESLRRLEVIYGELPVTLMARSPSGSIHRYVQVAGGRPRHQKFNVQDRPRHRRARRRWDGHRPAVRGAGQGRLCLDLIM